MAPPRPHAYVAPLDPRKVLDSAAASLRAFYGWRVPIDWQRAAHVTCPLCNRGAEPYVAEHATDLVEHVQNAHHIRRRYCGRVVVLAVLAQAVECGP